MRESRQKTLTRRLPFFLIISILSLSTLFVLNAYAITTDNYVIDPLDTNNSVTHDSSTDSYNLSNQQVGDVGVGEGGMSSYDLRHGLLYPEGGEVQINFTYLPEGRYGPVNTNNQTNVVIEVRNVGAGQNSILFSQQVTTNSAGQYSNLVLTGIAPGSYDITAKGWANLRLLKSNFSLSAGNNNIDFSDGSTVSALAGDINNFTRTTLPYQSVEVGDNIVGAADYSTLVSNYQIPNERYDFDGYGGGAGAADYSRLVSNYGQVGQ